MTVKVGDKVRCTINRSDVRAGVEYIVDKIDGAVVRVTDDAGDLYWLCRSEYEPITPTPISTQLRARMEEHMSNGEYVRAVKWALLAEQAEALENE